MTVFYFMLSPSRRYLLFFFFNDTATTEIYTLSLHDALPILEALSRSARDVAELPPWEALTAWLRRRSEEHTSELQSHLNLVCRLLLEKKKITNTFKTAGIRALSRKTPTESSGNARLATKLHS